jgi:hypothetical protein
LKRTIVQETKAVLKSSTNLVLNSILPSSRAVSNKSERRANTPLELNPGEILGSDVFNSWFQSQKRINVYSAGFYKLNERLRRNARQIFSGASGSKLSIIFSAFGFSDESKSLLLFHSPSKTLELLENEASYKIENIYVLAVSVKKYNIESIVPICTINLDPPFKADQRMLKKGPKQLEKSWKQTASDLAHAKCRHKVIRKTGRLGNVYVPVGEPCLH